MRTIIILLLVTVVAGNAQDFRIGDTYQQMLQRGDNAYYSEFFHYHEYNGKFIITIENTDENFIAQAVFKDSIITVTKETVYDMDKDQYIEWADELESVLGKPKRKKGALYFYGDGFGVILERTKEYVEHTVFTNQ